MSEPLVVDPARLKTSGITLRDQVLPAAPPPISTTGSDSVSAAINVTMPIIESPVTAGLSDVQAAFENTGSKIVAAADKYAETDQLLGAHVATVQFLGAGDSTHAPTEQPARAATARTPATPDDAKGDKKDDNKDAGQKPAPAPNPIDFSQVSAMMQGMQPISQGMQGVMSSVQQAGSAANAGASPPKLADETKRDGSTKPDEKPSGEAQLVDATTADGAASGGQGAGSAPVQPTTGDRPTAAPAETA
ncbi:ESX-1 secretion-associated protein EspJ [Mycobacterium shigaense]|uniref:ESX-1 secretion-associated protein EspJ n=2 Tax=Mycobacterium shigaense TaxID=722731 RepID=A0A1Z4EPX0_9MYCO|nr:ESX-1 secretion-associated protein EspJ [Mycobacterium shigaense]